MIVTVCSNLPPGGRCRLYLAYAKSIADTCSAAVCVIHPDAPQPASPPALLIDDEVVEPEDGFMLTPDDIVRALERAGVANPAVRETLERAQGVIAG